MGGGNNGCNLHLVRQEAATVSCILYCFGRENSIFIRENSGKSVNCMIFLATMIKKFKITMMLHLGISTCCDFLAIYLVFTCRDFTKLAFRIIFTLKLVLDFL